MKSERQIPCDTTYMWNLKYDTNEPIYKTELWTKKTNVVAKGVGVEEGWSGRLGLADVSFYI